MRQYVTAPTAMPLRRICPSWSPSPHGASQFWVTVTYFSFSLDVVWAIARAELTKRIFTHLGCPEVPFNYGFGASCAFGGGIGAGFAVGWAACALCPRSLCFNFQCVLGRLWVWHRALAYAPLTCPTTAIFLMIVHELML